MGIKKSSTYYYTRNRIEIGTMYRLRTPKIGLGRAVGEVSVNLKANSLKHYLKALIGRQSYYQVIRGRELEGELSEVRI